MPLDTNRRNFLKGSAALLVIGLNAKGVLAAAPDAVSINPFVTISADGTVSVIAKHFEMGQGASTGLATLVAEELDADWAQVRIEFAPADATRYANLSFGSQGTGGSTAMANSFMQYRQAGAAARAVLVEAAARKWGVPAGQISVETGTVRGPGSRQSSFGDLIRDAADITPPAEPELKKPEDFRLIGKEGVGRLDSASKVNGTALFASDVRLPDMVVAVIARPPRFGGTVSGFDATAAMETPGVVAVHQIPAGIAVYAEDTWSALRGRDALSIEWDFANAENRSTEALEAVHIAALDEDGIIARDDGDAGAALAGSASVIEHDFFFPFLAHAPMETEACVVQLRDGGAKIWDGCQFPSVVQPVAAGILGVAPEAIEIETLYAGGSFGRRANAAADYVAEGVMAAKALGDGRPVKLIWTREDDIRGGYWRPMYAHRLSAAIGEDGKPSAWAHRLAGKSILVGTPFEAMLVQDGLDATSVEGARGLPYAVPNIRVDVRNMEHGASVLWWRSVGHTHTAYSTEIMIDLLAEAAGADPVEYRLALLGEQPRLEGVLRAVAKAAEWQKPPAPGISRGVAVHESFASYVAQVVEISLQDERVKLERVVCAVDCGIVINPDVVRAQMEGGIGYGLGHAMRNKITMADGEVVEQNFPDYEPLRLSDMPKIEVVIVPSAEPPTGVGEPGLPPVAPALANAIRAATGKLITRLPMSDAGIDFA